VISNGIEEFSNREKLSDWLKRSQEARNRQRDLAVDLIDDLVCGLQPTTERLDRYRRSKLDYLDIQAEGLPF